MGVRWDTGKHSLPYPYSEGDQAVACKSIALTIVFFFIVSEVFGVSPLNMHYSQAF